MKLRTKRHEQWITKELDGETGEFLINILTPEEKISVFKQNIKYEWDNHQRFEKPDPYTYRILTIDKTIKDWKNIKDENDKPLECNKKNKELLYAYNPAFINELLEDVDKIEKELNEKKETEEKN